MESFKKSSFQTLCRESSSLIEMTGTLIHWIVILRLILNLNALVLLIKPFFCVQLWHFSLGQAQVRCSLFSSRILNWICLSAKFYSHQWFDRNPGGRTGIRGKGGLKSLGPNHILHPVLTRWNPLELNSNLMSDWSVQPSTVPQHWRDYSRLEMP